VFGGTDCAGNFYSDLWILSNADGTTGTPNWTLAAPLGVGPSARSQATAVYDSTNNVMTVFAGGTVSTTAFNDVFTLSNANGLSGVPIWIQLVPAGTPPSARSGQSAIYDAANNRMVIHGGISIRGAVQNDSWILSVANGIGTTPTWTQLNPTAAGPFRRSHTAIYDSVSDNLIRFGGAPGGTLPPLNDVWQEAGVAAAGQQTVVGLKWIQLFPTGTTPSARFGHSGIYDSGSNRMIVFGGGTSSTA